MLEVRAIKKFHDEKGILIGYTIEDEATGQKMNVYKDQLKQAVMNNQCKVVNMTLTSDGRFIGKAAPKPVKKQPKRELTGISLLEIYTNGKNISAVMINELQHKQMNNISIINFEGLKEGIGFDVGHEAINNIKNEWYDNIKIVDGKPDLSVVKRKSFKSIKDKLIKILKVNNYMPTFNVTKGENKYEYVITINEYDINKTDLTQIIYCLIEDAMYTSKLKVNYIDEDKFHVSCMTGINDVRKALKEIK